MSNNPNGRTTKMTVVLLHGYGSCGASMTHLAQALALPDVEFWCPDGPEICAEYPQGRQWFSLKGLDWSAGNIDQVWKGIEHPLADAARKFYTQNQERWDQLTSPIVVAGFSQGAMMAYELGFFGPRVQAVMGFSGAYCLKKSPTHQPDLFWTHALDDDVVRYAWMKESDAVFVRNGMLSEHCVTASGGHSMNQESILATRAFLTKMLEQVVVGHHSILN